MSCVVEFNEPFIRFDFNQNQYKQKVWLDALLRYGSLNLKKLAFTLDLDEEILQQVHNGKYFLKACDAEKIARLFLILFSD